MPTARHTALPGPGHALTVLAEPVPGVGATCGFGRGPGRAGRVRSDTRTGGLPRGVYDPRMSAPTDPLALAADFPDASEDDWRALVSAVLAKSGHDEGADPIEALSATTYDGIEIRPLVSLPARRRPSRANRTAARGTCAPGTATRMPRATNAAIRNDLETGATSLWLRLGDGGLAVETSRPRWTGCTSIWRRSCSTPATGPPPRRGAARPRTRRRRCARHARRRPDRLARPHRRRRRCARRSASSSRRALPEAAHRDRRRDGLPRCGRERRRRARDRDRGRRRLPARAHRRRPGRGRGPGPHRVPVRGLGRPVRVYREAARRASGVGPGGRAVLASDEQTAAAARGHVRGDDDPTRPVGEHAAHDDCVLRRCGRRRRLDHRAALRHRARPARRLRASHCAQHPCGAARRVEHRPGDRRCRWLLVRRDATRPQLAEKAWDEFTAIERDGGALAALDGRIASSRWRRPAKRAPTTLRTAALR